MNRPDKVGEPSMEEILASIRQIIADDPPSDRGGLAVEPNPLVPQSASPPNPNESPRSDGRTPLVDRLSDVLKNGPLPPTSPLGSKRPLSFDQDLADMFEEGDGKAGTPVPKPDLRVPFEPSSTVKATPAQVATDERASPMASSFVSSPSAPSSSAPPSFGAPAESSVPPMPFGGASAPQPAAPPAPAPPKTFGFPPLRKQSFYPPQPKATPELPPIPAKEPETAKADVVGSQAASGDDDGGLESAIARLTGLGAVVPGQSGSPAQTGHNGASLNGASLNGSASLKDAGGLKGSGSLNGSAALNGSGSLNGAGAFGSLGSASKFSAAPFEPALPDLSVTPDFAPVEPEPVADATEPVVTFDQAPFGARSSVPASDVPPVADAARATVAAQALDALAQGLAASAAAAAQPAIPLTPVVEPAPEALRASGAPHVQTLPVATLAPAQAPSRTLEDAVAEMLRPMLQQWVSDNMPRIIEKALRVEVARNVKPDLASKS